MSAQLQSNGHTPPAVTTTEPPRATARFISPNGVGWLVTVPAPTVAELLDRVALVEDKLLALDGDAQRGGLWRYRLVDPLL